MFIPGRFYRYRKRFNSALRSNLKVGEVYQFADESDFFPETKKQFRLMNAFSDDFEIVCSYDVLDQERIENFFEEVPKPSWWDAPRQPLGE